jgi:hypothetical protein
MTTDRQLKNGKNALHDLGCTERVSYEDGSSSDGTEVHDKYRVWPTNECDKHAIVEACEKHSAEGYTLSPSMTPPKHDYIYVTVQTTSPTE